MPFLVIFVAGLFPLFIFSLFFFLIIVLLLPRFSLTLCVGFTARLFAFSFVVCSSATTFGPFRACCARTTVALTLFTSATTMISKKSKDKFVRLLFMDTIFVKKGECVLWFTMRKRLRTCVGGRAWMDGIWINAEEAIPPRPFMIVCMCIVCVKAYSVLVSASAT